MTTSNHHTKHKDGKHIAAHTTSDFSKVVKGAKGGRAAQIQTKTRLTPDTRIHRSKEAERLTSHICTPCSGVPGPPSAGAGPTALPRHARLLGEGVEGEKKGKTKEEKEKGTLEQTKTW